MPTVIKRSGFQKFYAFYLLFSLLGPFFHVLIDHSILFSLDLSILIAFGFYAFYFLSGINYWITPNSKASTLLVEISLILQSVQFDILGLKFKSYYGPYLAMGYRNDVHFHFDLDFSLFRFRGINAIEEFSPDVFIYFNIIAILLLFKFIRHKKMETPEDDFLLDPE